jgi:hypothetical protein
MDITTNPTDDQLEDLAIYIFGDHSVFPQYDELRYFFNTAVNAERARIQHVATRTNLELARQNKEAVITAYENYPVGSGEDQEARDAYQEALETSAADVPQLLDTITALTENQFTAEELHLMDSALADIDNGQGPNHELRKKLATLLKQAS